MHPLILSSLSIVIWHGRSWYGEKSGHTSHRVARSPVLGHWFTYRKTQFCNRFLPASLHINFVGALLRSEFHIHSYMPSTKKAQEFEARQCREPVSSQPPVMPGDRQNKDSATPGRLCSNSRMKTESRWIQTNKEHRQDNTAQHSRPLPSRNLPGSLGEGCYRYHGMEKWACDSSDERLLTIALLFSSPAGCLAPFPPLSTAPTYLPWKYSFLLLPVS